MSREMKLVKFENIKFRSRKKLAWVDADGDVILSGYGSEGYPIRAGRLDSPEKLVEWIMHLSEKNWVTKHHLADLAKAYAKINGLPLWPGC